MESAANATQAVCAERVEKKSVILSGVSPWAKVVGETQSKDL